VIGCGINKVISHVTMGDKEEIIKLLCIHDVIVGCKSVIDQFIDGLN